MKRQIDADMQESTLVAQRNAVVEQGLFGAAIGRQRAARAAGIAAIGERGVAAIRPGLENDVDDARQRVRSILGGRAVGDAPLFVGAP
jgi:hypothetical protein